MRLFCVSLLFLSLLRISYSQVMFSYELPEQFIVNSKENIFLDDQFGLLVITGTGKAFKAILFEHQSGKKASEFNCLNCNLEYKGHSITDKNIFVYYAGFWNGEKGFFSMRFEKKIGAYPFTAKFYIDENIDKKESPILSYSINNEFIQVYLREKENLVIVFKVQSPEKIKAEKFTVDAASSKALKDKKFHLINPNEQFDFFSLSGDKAYLVDGKITFVAQRTFSGMAGNIRLIHLNEQVINFDIEMEASVDGASSFVLGDLLFVFQKEKEMFVGDEISMLLYDWKRKNTLKSFKFHSKSDSIGIESVYRSPVYNTDGDSLDHKWTSNEIRKKLHNLLGAHTNIGAMYNDQGHLLITLVAEIIATSAGVPAGPGMGGTVGGGSYGTGEFQYFNMLISPKDYEIVKGDIKSLITEAIKKVSDRKQKSDIFFHKKNACLLFVKKGKLILEQIL